MQDVALSDEESQGAVAPPSTATSAGLGEQGVADKGLGSKVSPHTLPNSVSKKILALSY